MHRHVVVTVVLFAWGLACSGSGNWSRIMNPCDKDHPCASGFECINGFCRIAQKDAVNNKDQMDAVKNKDLDIQVDRIDAASEDGVKENEIVHRDAGGEDINVKTDNREIEFYDVKPDVSSDLSSEDVAARDTGKDAPEDVYDGQTHCADGLTACDDVCVNLQKDSQNCGKCGHHCAEGQSCSEGKCINGCTGIKEPNGGCRCERGLWWELNFDRDPTQVDVNGDGKGDWRIRDGSAFDTSQLSGGIWHAPAWVDLDTVPDWPFDVPTSVHVRYRAASAGGRGAVFWINADTSVTEQVSIYAALSRTVGGQELRVMAKDADGNDVELARYSGLSNDFIDLWMSLDVEKDEVLVWVQGAYKGSYHYPTHKPYEDEFATLVGYGCDAEFDYVRIESCPDGVTTPKIPEPQPPAAPSDLTANTTSYDSVDLSWKDNANNETAYEVQWRTSDEPTFTKKKVISANSTSYTVTALQADTQYVFRVAAINAYGRSGYSNEATATTPHAPSIDCAASNVLCVDDTGGPFQEYSTIQKAVDAAKGGDVIYVANGLYRESVLIKKSNITLSAMPGDKDRAVISGAELITGWKLATSSELDGNPNVGSIYVADSPCQGEILRLFHGEGELPASRYPHADKKGEARYLHISWVDSNNPRRVFSSDDISKFSNGHFTGARVHVRTAQWRIGASRVSSSSSSGAVHLASGISGYDMAPKWGFFFTQVVGEIRASGEWAWKNGKIYLMWTGGKPSAIEAACRDWGIKVVAPVQNVTISGLTIRRERGDGIVVTKGDQQGVLITNNSISGCAGSGVRVEPGSGQVKVRYNHISDCWFAGINFWQTTAPEAIGNVIDSIGTSEYNGDVLTNGGFSECCGIMMIDGNNAKIANNDIKRVAYNGISVIDFTDAKGREIEQNYVDNAMLGLNDGGGIYLAVYQNNVGGWDEIHDNLVTNCIGSFLGTSPSSGYYPQGVGIYLDDRSQRVYVHDNVTAGNELNIFLHDANQCRVNGNLAYGGGMHRTKNVLYTNLRGYVNGKYTECKGGTHAQNEVTDNIYFSTSSKVPALNLDRRSACSEFSVSDRNKFYAPSTKILEKVNDTYYKYDLSGWQAKTGLDSHSVTLSASCAKSFIVLNLKRQQVTCSGGGGCVNINGGTISMPTTIKPLKALIFCGCTNTVHCQ